MLRETSVPGQANVRAPFQLIYESRGASAEAPRSAGSSRPHGKKMISLLRACEVGEARARALRECRRLRPTGEAEAEHARAVVRARVGDVCG